MFLIQKGKSFMRKKIVFNKSVKINRRLNIRRKNMSR